MDQYEKDIEDAFNRAQKFHSGLVEDWSKNRDQALALVDYLGLVSARFEKNWRNWLGVSGKEKRRALKTCKRLREAAAECKAQIFKFTSDVI